MKIIGNRYVEFRTQQTHVVPVLLVNIVSSMESDEPVRWHTPNPSPRYDALTAKVIGTVRNPRPVAPVGIQFVGMHIDGFSFGCPKNEVVLRTVRSGHLEKALGPIAEFSTKQPEKRATRYPSRHVFVFAGQEAHQLPTRRQCKCSAQPYAPSPRTEELMQLAFPSFQFRGGSFSTATTECSHK